MRKLFLIASVVCAMILTSFSFTNDEQAVGKYGINGINGPEIILNTDHTFSYKDFTNENKRIDTQGKWEYKNGLVILKDYESKNKIVDKWNLVREGKCLKGRKAMTFYTLCDC